MANVLIVDDSRTSRKILKNLLEGIGHTVVGEAVDGEEGYLKYKELKPDVVTLDITMPKLDGLEALQLIKKFDEGAKVIMITAAGQKEKMISAVKNGAKEFVSKPIEEDEIKQAIERVMND